MITPISDAAPTKTSPRVPVYLSAADALAETIANQLVGTRLPSEDELASMFHRRPSAGGEVAR